MNKTSRLVVGMAVLFGLSALVSMGASVTVLDVLIGAAVGAAIGYAIAALIWGRSQKAKDRARVGTQSAAWHIGQIPPNATLPDRLGRLDALRENRDISRQDFEVAKAELLGTVQPAQPVVAPEAPASTVPPKSHAAHRPNPPVTKPETPTKFPSSRDETVERLRELKSLHDEGILTDEEYESKRKRHVDKL